jgi:hydrogenase nickel incorporation protein HypB
MCAICGCEGDHESAGHSHEGHVHEGQAHSHSEHEHPKATHTQRLEEAVLARNDGFAQYNRGWLAGRRILAVNLLGAPGAGKTALLERLARDGLKLFVIEADLATDRDAARVRAAGATVLQVNTGTVCHLDAHTLGHALEELSPDPGSTLIIENVGNLVCPAMFDLGEREKMLLWSVTEGEDKPIKYPHMFARATSVVLTKTDLLPHVPFDVDVAWEFLRKVNPRARGFRVSSRAGTGMDELADHLRGLVGSS